MVQVPSRRAKRPEVSCSYLKDGTNLGGYKGGLVVKNLQCGFTYNALGKMLASQACEEEKRKAMLKEGRGNGATILLYL